MFTEIIYDGSDMGFNFPVPVNEVIVFKTIKQWQLRKGPYTTGFTKASLYICANCSNVYNSMTTFNHYL